VKVGDTTQVGVAEEGYMVGVLDGVADEGNMVGVLEGVADEGYMVGVLVGIIEEFTVKSDSLFAIEGVGEVGNMDGNAE